MTQELPPCTCVVCGTTGPDAHPPDDWVTIGRNHPSVDVCDKCARSDANLAQALHSFIARLRDGYMPRRVIVESPFKGDVERNKRYLEACLRDCVMRGESPYASHKMLTDCLDDTNPEERRLGITAGYSWWVTGELIVFYTDLGWSDGMSVALSRCENQAILYETRRLPKTDPFWDNGKETP